MFESDSFPEFDFEVSAHQRRQERLKGMQDPKRIAGPQHKLWRLIERAQSEDMRFIMPEDDEAYDRLLQLPAPKNYNLIDPWQSPESL